MTLNIKLKRSSTKDSKPTSAQLEDGELGVNYNKDSLRLYVKDSDGTVRTIAGNGAEGNYWQLSSTDLSPTDNTYGVNIGADNVRLFANGTGLFTGKVTSASTASTDGGTTLTTKDYVDGKISSEDFWDRSGDILSPTNSGDNLDNLGSITAAGGNYKLNPGGAIQTAGGLYTGWNFTDSTYQVYIQSNGNVEAKGTITAGQYDQGTADKGGVQLWKDGAVSVQRATGNVNVIQVYKGNSASTNFAVTSEGQVTAAGEVKIGGTSAAPNLKIFSNGSIQGNGNTAGSNKNGYYFTDDGRAFFSSASNQILWQGYTTGTSTPTSKITAAGEISSGSYDLSKDDVGGVRIRNIGEIDIQRPTTQSNKSVLDVRLGSDQKLNILADGTLTAWGTVTASTGGPVTNNDKPGISLGSFANSCNILIKNPAAYESASNGVFQVLSGGTNASNLRIGMYSNGDAKFGVPQGANQSGVEVGGNYVIAVTDGIYDWNDVAPGAGLSTSSPVGTPFTATVAATLPDPNRVATQGNGGGNITAAGGVVSKQTSDYCFGIQDGNGNKLGGLYQASNNDTSLYLKNLKGTQIHLKGSDGSASFTGVVLAGDAPGQGDSKVGAVIDPSGYFAAARQGNQSLWLGFKYDNSSYTSKIDSDGDAEFYGVLTLKGIGGTDTVVSVLDKDDSLKTTIGFNANGSAVFTGTVTATVVPPSDARFKENIAPANPQLADVVALGGLLKNFDWNDDAPLNKELRSQRQLGLIAQEVAEVCPSLVKDIHRTKQGKELTPEEVIPAVVEPAYTIPAVTKEIPNPKSKTGETITVEVKPAQEVPEKVITPEQVIPATYEVLDDSYKGLSQEALIMKLIGAVAELTAEVNALKSA